MYDDPVGNKTIRRGIVGTFEETFKLATKYRI